MNKFLVLALLSATASARTEIRRPGLSAMRAPLMKLRGGAAAAPTKVVESSVIQAILTQVAKEVSSANTSHDIDLSAKTGLGIDRLRAKLLETAGWQPASEGLYLARERHVQALKRVQSHIEMADAHLRAQAQSLDLLAEELRLSQTALNEITGEFNADDLLGVIFSSFCIGK